MSEIEDFPGGWHKQITREHICIWSDEWLENKKKQQEKLNLCPTCNKPMDEYEGSEYCNHCKEP